MCIYSARLVASSWQQDEHPDRATRGRQRGTLERESPLRHGHRQQTAVPCTRFQNAVPCSHSVIFATVPPSIWPQLVEFRLTAPRNSHRPTPLTDYVVYDYVTERLKAEAYSVWFHHVGYISAQSFLLRVGEFNLDAGKSIL